MVVNSDRATEVPTSDATRRSFFCALKDQKVRLGCCPLLAQSGLRPVFQSAIPQFCTVPSDASFRLISIKDQVSWPRGNVTMLVADTSPRGSNKQNAESTTGRIGEDVQRAKENISDAAASARDDITADLRRLSADVTSLKDTVALLAKTVTGEVGEAASGIGGDIASVAKDQANTLLSEFEVVARRNPLGVVIGAFGIGILIGIMKGRR